MVRPARLYGGGAPTTGTDVPSAVPLGQRAVEQRSLQFSAPALI